MKEQTFLRDGRWVPLSQIKPKKNNKKTSEPSTKDDGKEDSKK